MKNLQPGDIVVSKIRKRAYYSNYGSNPEQYLEQGQQAIFVAESWDVTSKTGRDRKSFVVDFIGAKLMFGGSNWRASLHAGEFRKLKKGEVVSPELLALKEALHGHKF